MNGSNAWLIAGTIPIPEFSLYDGVWSIDSENPSVLRCLDKTVPVSRGTAALLGAACLCCAVLGVDMPGAVLAGDTGRGRGSRAVYAHLTKTMPERMVQGITFHYLMPDVKWHNRLLESVRCCPKPPLLVADAGFMYVAKMSGFAAEYDLFTPDAGEIAFLADEHAPHPFYTRGFLLHEEKRVPELIHTAYKGKNAAAHLLVKGETDYVVERGEIKVEVRDPMVPFLEPIGGTGDTVAGITSAFLAAGFPMLRACALAARANRIMGVLASPTPATQIADLLRYLPQAVRMTLHSEPVET